MLPDNIYSSDHRPFSLDVFVGACVNLNRDGQGCCTGVGVLLSGITGSEYVPSALFGHDSNVPGSKIDCVRMELGGTG